MTTGISKYYFVIILITVLYSTVFAQNSITAVEYMKSHHSAISTLNLLSGDSCSVLNPEIHDANIHSNAYSKVSDTVCWTVMFRPNTYPWIYKSVCVGFASVAPGASLTYRIVVYDTAINATSTLLYESAPITITNIPLFPNYQWYSNVIDLPAVYRGPVYIGVIYSNQPDNNVLICADETSNAVWPGNVSTYIGYPPIFTPIQQNQGFQNYKCLAIRTEGEPLIADNFTLRAPDPATYNNYVTIPSREEMSGLNAITIEAWVNITTRAHGNILLEKGGPVGGYVLLLNGNTALDPYPVFVNDTNIIHAYGIFIQPGFWQHFAFTYDGATAKFYINAKLVYSRDVQMPAISAAGDMKIAGSSIVDPFGGMIDEMRFWNVARTQGQIDSNKCIKSPSGFIGGHDGLLAQWHFDNSFVDSVSGWDGIPHGTITFDTVSRPIAGVRCIEVPIGIQQQGMQVPKNYLLGQNYPNPFNPSTEISFSLPKDEYVELKVYDITGNEIATLLREPVKTGNYKVSFDASNFASGVYFYTLTAGSFKESKKMVLIK